ncbi:MAG: DUF4926 domain-containing protein [Gemmatimonadaceae bacterium]
MTHLFRELDSVVLLRDLPEAQLCAGDLGAIMLAYERDAYEVEFVKASGAAQAVITLNGADIRLLRDSDVLAARPPKP